MTTFSGRTTAYEHKHPGWETRDGTQESAIKQVTLFDAQWSDCPVEVETEVKKLWRDHDFGNDHYYFSWDRGDMLIEFPDGGDESKDGKSGYPLIDEYLLSKGVTKCLIHWWW